MTDRNGARDFDFLFGAWRVSHRKLKQRLAGSDEWVAFEGTMTAQSILGGTGNFDDGVMEDPSGGYSGATLRRFDPATREWSIWWFDERFPGPADPPVKGRFENGVGTFTCEDTFNGKPIIVRYQWRSLTPDTARWEQAFSPDGGASWETNWTMQFVREA